MPVVEAKDLVREYAAGRGVCGISLSVEAGECYALLGRNGSGKSTLTRLLLGLERPDGGELTVLGHPVPAAPRGHLSRLGAALDTSVHWEALSGWANAGFVARAYGMAEDAIRSRLGELFELADLASQADEPVSRWSFGMRRKLSLVEALCHQPELLVLDEPTAGVDEHFLVRLAERVRDRSAAGRTTWVAANDAEWLAGVATRVAFLDGGRLVAEGAVGELVGEVAPLREVQITLAAVAEVPRPDLDGLRALSQEGTTLRALVEDDRALTPRLIEHVVAAGGQVQRVEVLRSTLREAFLLKTGEALDE